MSFFSPDKITIKRSDGTVLNNVSASVQDIIFIDDVTTPVEIGDTAIQTLPSGLKKTMIVTDVQVFNAGSGLDHMEIKYTTA